MKFGNLAGILLGATCPSPVAASTGQPPAVAGFTGHTLAVGSNSRIVNIVQPAGPVDTNTATSRGGLAEGFADVVNVKDRGAKGDATFAPNYCTIASGSTALNCPGASFTLSDVGKTIVVHGAGSSGTPLQTTIAAWVDVQDVTLAAAAQTATPLFYAKGEPFDAAVTFPGNGTASYAIGDMLNLFGGASFTVQTLRVISASVSAGGSGGTNTMSCIVQGTTGTTTTTPFQATVTVSGGAITAVGSISFPGQYWAAPTTLTAEPVTAYSNCGGLTGAKLSVVMGADTVNWASAGSYAIQPSGASAASGGAGSGATITPQWYESGITAYGTDDWPAINAAYAAAQAANKAVYLPAGSYMLASQGSASLSVSQGTRIFGDGPAAKRVEAGAGSQLLVLSTGAPLFQVHGGISLQGVDIEYPLQDGTAPAPIAYPPTISGDYFDWSTIADTEISGAYDCMALTIGSGSAMGRSFIERNRWDCKRYAFAAYNGTADIVYMRNNLWMYGNQQPVGGGGGVDPFGNLWRYQAANAEAIHIDIANGAHTTIDGLYLSQNFAHGQRHGVHVVSGGVTLSKWVSDYWETETHLQIEAVAYMTSSVLTGEGGYSQPRNMTRANPEYNLLTVAGTAPYSTELVMQAPMLQHSNGDAIKAVASGVGLISLSGGELGYYGQSATKGVYNGLNASGTGGNVQMLDVTGVKFDPINSYRGTSQYGIDYASTIAAAITGNVFKDVYIPIVKSGYTGSDIIANNAGYNLTGPYFVLDQAASTTYADVSGNTSAKPESNIWHPGQRNAATGVTAKAGGGAPSATLLTAYSNEVTTVATASDSVKLPPAIGKGCIVVTNNSANALAIYGNPTPNGNSTADTINKALSASLNAGKTGIWCSSSMAKWLGGNLN